MKKRRSIKRIKKRHTMKKYKGGALTSEQTDAIKNLRTRFFKDYPLKNKFINDLTLKTIQTVKYNISYLNSLNNAYTFSKNGYFINDILEICKNEEHRKNYYALCILIRLFYSKDAATSYSYFTLTRNIVENCEIMQKINKQKLLMDTIKDNHKQGIKEILKTSNFYDLLKDIMNNTQPIKKLKSMENKQTYKIYSHKSELNNIFVDCLTDSEAPKTGGAMILAPMAASMAKSAVTSMAKSAVTSMAKEGASIMKQGPKAAYSMLNAATLGTSTTAGKIIQNKFFKKDEKTVEVPAPPESQSPAASPAASPVEQNILSFYQDKIESFFIINKKPCSYMILYILNNILNKINKLKFIHNDIPYIHNDNFCDHFYKNLEKISFTGDKEICKYEKEMNSIFE